MVTEAQKLRLFERVRAQTGWLIRDPDWRNDVTQEAWILALKYAQKRSRLIDNLSNTELKYRCFEAARKLRTKEITLSPETIQNLPLYQLATTEEESHDQEAGAAVERVGSIEFILRHHPTMFLTPTQWAIYNELKNFTPLTANTWKAHYARQLGVTRQDVYNIERTVCRKVAFANDFTELLRGDIEGFFKKYANNWTAPLVRKGVWSLFMHRVRRTNPLTKRLEILNERMQGLAHQILTKEAWRNRQGIFNSDQLSCGYHLLVSSVFTRPKEAAAWLEQLRYEISRNDWLISRFIARGLRDVGEGKPREEFKEGLKSFVTNETDEAKRFASYICAYYGHNPQYADSYLHSGGRLLPDPLTTDQVVRESYKNITEIEYQQSNTQLDINFLRLLLVIKQYGIKLSTRGVKNSLITVCQKALHSPDPFIVREAERLLTKVRDD